MIERDRFLTEAMGHKFKTPGHGTCCTCSACGYDYDNCICIDYSEWHGFGILWEWSSKQEWFGTFSKFHTIASDKDNMAIDQVYIDPERFADAIYEFLNKEVVNKMEENGGKIRCKSC